MKRILFFEIPVFTGATRVTRTIAKKISNRFETSLVVIYNISDPCKEIQQAINREHPDCLFSSFTTINPDVIEVGKENGLTVIVRSDYNIKTLSQRERDRVLVTYNKADWVIVQTKEMMLDMLSYQALWKCRIKIIDNPIDEEEILVKSTAPNPFPDNGNYHFLWVGRKDPIKDLPTLRKAFAIVHEQYPNTDLTLITGDPNPFKWINNADCLVISSISEASPNVLREALFLKTRVVSTDCSPTVKDLLPLKNISQVGNAYDLATKMMESIYYRDNREIIKD